ncbi:MULTISPECIES: hypothetical protein [Okeania]|uniref:hypothetical protein n=1 Tax=Okeania TaxID=1458928 RepID=UPI00137535B7|nr:MULTISPECIES: hypothetical protein [Okeania]NET16261.1 hypothetical protein [Okeania sp. SIO1H6]NEP72862.1 hypothetical protein [Okeania sp. SIO2G5]NEP87993.1 hypothetical protein [Okeania sp. SIO2C2]NEP93649.1 hypothetical protein [Okeania sp. SIO2F5]NEQ91620.1 hypothetical protein [Okeania sp. SIO2G4]
MAIAVYTKNQNYFQNIHTNHRIIDDTDEDDNRVEETISISYHFSMKLPLIKGKSY